MQEPVLCVVLSLHNIILHIKLIYSSVFVLSRDTACLSFTTSTNINKFLDKISLKIVF